VSKLQGKQILTNSCPSR